MEQLAEMWMTSELAEPEVTAIETTLYDLVEAINEEVGPEEDHLVSEIVLDLLDRGRIRFLDPKGKVEFLWPCQ
jgi:hypothetical protein